MRYRQNRNLTHKEWAEYAGGDVPYPGVLSGVPGPERVTRSHTVARKRESVLRNTHDG